MSAESVARQYARALYDVAHRNDLVDAVHRDLVRLRSIIRDHAELTRVLALPTIEQTSKKALVDHLLTLGNSTIELHRLVDLLADRDRLALLPAIAAAFETRLVEAGRTITADVTTAVPLTPERRQALAAALGRATARQVDITEHVDPSILGGVVARVGSVVFDGSVTRQLERMREKLLANG